MWMRNVEDRKERFDRSQHSCFPGVSGVVFGDGHGGARLLPRLLPHHVCDGEPPVVGAEVPRIYFNLMQIWKILV